jgi:large subunit ribosomal protein L24
MAKSRIKKDETVVVISGAEKGRRGKVLRVDREKQLVVVEGINVRKKTRRRSQEHPEGGIMDLECPIHISNVMAADRYDARRGEAASKTAAPQS